MDNFWKATNKPLMALAPMDDVTDTVFREVILSVSDPERLHVVFTEFTSIDGLCHPAGSLKTLGRLFVNDSERELLKARNCKLVAQIWGSDPEKFFKAAGMIASMGIFDGIDINMGCPVKKMAKRKSCSALINFPELAKEIVRASMSGSSLPVSVKTRIGVKEIITETWISHLLEVKPQAITIHGRTQKMMSTGNALWDEIGKAVTLRDSLCPSTVILGNGDVTSYSEALDKVTNYGVDGVMVGTGIFKDPWLFGSQKEISLKTRIALLHKHIALFEKTWMRKKNYSILKRFYKIYLKGFDGAAEWRDLAMKAEGYREAVNIILQLHEQLAA